MKCLRGRTSILTLVWVAAVVCGSARFIAAQPDPPAAEFERIRERLADLNRTIEKLESSIGALGDSIDKLERRAGPDSRSDDAGGEVIDRLASRAATPGRPDSIRFNRDIRPILSDTCYACHGPDATKRKAGLRFDDGVVAFEELESGRRAIVPGDTEASRLIERIEASDPDDRMPPEESGKSLTGEQRAMLRRWIEEGAKWEDHWSFIKPERPELPEVGDADWPRNPIDRFILSRLETEGVTPSPEAGRRTLIRRVSLDLIGLPPAPEEVEAFANDPDPRAYGKLVDRILASPHYGERWARHWLDAARYADSNGYAVDGPRDIWRWRDWVIDAINGDMPFDRFVTEQIAGDLMPDATRDQKIATGFNRNTMINEEGGIDKEEFRLEAVIDRVNTLGTVFLGLTMECARCHSHKFDPIAQREYFSLLSFFNSDEEVNLQLPTDELLAKRRDVRHEVETKRLDLERFLLESRREAQPEWEASLTDEELTKLHDAQRDALATKRELRNSEQDRLVAELFKKADKEYKRRAAEIKRLERRSPRIPTSMVLAPRAEPRPTHLFIGGDFTHQGESVAPGVPAALHPMPEVENPTRLDLARWLVDRDNPLLARVTVNRAWQRFFGRGIVETENDFGAQGSPPTHPELLDWLATEFIANGWSMKEIHRTIVTSATYRQASHTRPELEEADPSNRLLARQSRLRLDAEIIRDSGLVVSGLLNPKIGGPSVYPPQPGGVMKLGQSQRPWTPSRGDERFRRGLYTFFWRATPHPALTVFDAPDAMKSCTRRARSNTPLQALTLLNEGAFVEFAEALGRRLVDEIAEGDEARIDRAFEICLAREPAADERAVIMKLLESERSARARAGSAESGEADPELASWISVARVMLNLDEFITRE